jgi:hypothetical protein
MFIYEIIVFEFSKAVGVRHPSQVKSSQVKSSQVKSRVMFINLLTYDIELENFIMPIRLYRLL